MDWLQKSIWYGSIKGDTRLSQMYKISSEVIIFVENTTENWRVELTAGVKSLTEVKIYRRILQGQVL